MTEETNVSLNAELREKLADELEQKLAESMKAEVLLDVDDLSVTLFTEDGALPAIRTSVSAWSIRSSISWVR